VPVRKQRRITAEDLYRFQQITDCRISPDGRHVVFCLRRVERKTEKKFINLWIVPTDGGPARPFTAGDYVDTSPRWSPDGSQIAFLSNRAGEERSDIYLIPFHGGEAQRLTHLDGEWGTLEWSPDGRRLLCQFRKKDAEALEREANEQKKNLGVVYRHITRVFFKLDGYGFLPKERWHVWTVDVATGRARQLTDGPIYDELDPRWSPDGRQIVFVSNRTPDPDLDPEALDLFIMPAAGGEPRRIETPLGPKSNPSFSPDGRWLAYLGHEGRRMEWKNTDLWIVPLDGSAPARNLTEPFDFDVSASILNDLPSGLPVVSPTWSSDGRRLFFQVSRHGDMTLKSLAVDGDPASLETVVDGPGVVEGFGFDRQQAKLAYLYGTMSDPGQLWLRDMRRGRARPLTRVNAPLLRSLDLGQVEEVWFQGAAGNDLQGWILKPPDFDPKQRYPSILEIHGGPLLQYGHAFMHEFYYLAAHGYVVYFCNPRGGQGYGEAHSRAIWHNWGTADYEDLMAWADFVQQQPYIDPQRMGVTGGSYGGYMTVWIIGHTDRFRAAVTQRCVSNLISMYGSSDFNWSFEMEFSDRPPWDDFENYWRQSPLKYIGNAKTPTLVIHSEQDHRCAIEQGEQVFVALKRLGVETEMVRFPDEPHGLSRGGRTDRRIERLRRIRGWFDRYLKEG